MPTTRNKIVDTNSGASPDYTSASGWEAGEAADITAATGTDEIRQGECRASSGAADTTQFSFSATWATSSTNYARLYTVVGGSYRHNGTYQTGNQYRLEVNTVGGAIINCTNTIDLRVEGLQLVNTSAAGTDYCVRVNGGDGEKHIYDNIMVNTGGSGTEYGIRMAPGGSDPMFVRNNLIYDQATAGMFLELGSGDVGYFYNNTIVDCGTGFDVTSSLGTSKVRNIICNGNTTDFANTGNYTVAHSLTSEDATATGTNAQTSTAVTFANEASDDFRLQASTTSAKDDGQDLSADADMAFAVDVIGTARPQGSAWDRGFHELIQAGVRRVFVVS